jgi:hypothetical protein
MMFEQLKSDFEGDEGTLLVFPGPDPEKYPNAYDKEVWDSANKFPIRKGEWVSYCMVWNKARRVDYLQGVKRPRWAIGILYRWWYRRTILRSLKHLTKRLSD